MSDAAILPTWKEFQLDKDWRPILMKQLEKEGNGYKNISYYDALNTLGDIETIGEITKTTEPTFEKQSSWEYKKKLVRVENFGLPEQILYLNLPLFKSLVDAPLPKPNATEIEKVVYVFKVLRALESFEVKVGLYLLDSVKEISSATSYFLAIENPTNGDFIKMWDSIYKTFIIPLKSTDKLSPKSVDILVVFDQRNSISLVFVLLFVVKSIVDTTGYSDGTEIDKSKLPAGKATLAVKEVDTSKILEELDRQERERIAKSDREYQAAIELSRREAQQRATEYGIRRESEYEQETSEGQERQEPSYELPYTMEGEEEEKGQEQVFYEREQEPYKPEEERFEWEFGERGNEEGEFVNIEEMLKQMNEQEENSPQDDFLVYVTQSKTMKEHLKAEVYEKMNTTKSVWQKELNYISSQIKKNVVKPLINFYDKNINNWSQVWENINNGWQAAIIDHAAEFIIRIWLSEENLASIVTAFKVIEKDYEYSLLKLFGFWRAHLNAKKVDGELWRMIYYSDPAYLTGLDMGIGSNLSFIMESLRKAYSPKEIEYVSSEEEETLTNPRTRTTAIGGPPSAEPTSTPRRELFIAEKTAVTRLEKDFDSVLKSEEQIISDIDSKFENIVRDLYKKNQETIEAIENIRKANQALIVQSRIGSSLVHSNRELLANTIAVATSRVPVMSSEREEEIREKFAELESKLEEETTKASITFDSTWRLYFKMLFPSKMPDSIPEELPPFMLRYTHMDFQYEYYPKEYKQKLIMALGDHIISLTPKHSGRTVEEFFAELCTNVTSSADLIVFENGMKELTKFVNAYYLAMISSDSSSSLAPFYANMNQRIIFLLQQRDKAEISKQTLEPTEIEEMMGNLSTSRDFERSALFLDPFIRIMHHLIVGAWYMPYDKAVYLSKLFFSIISDFENKHLPASCIYIFHSINNTLNFKPDRFEGRTGDNNIFRERNTRGQSQVTIMYEKVFTPLVSLVFHENDVDIMYMILFLVATSVDPFFSEGYLANDEIYRYIARDSFGDGSVLLLYRGRYLPVEALNVYRKHASKLLKEVFQQAIVGNREELRRHNTGSGKTGPYEVLLQTTRLDEDGNKIDRNYAFDTTPLFQRAVFSGYSGGVGSDVKKDVEKINAPTYAMMEDPMDDSIDVVDILSKMHVEHTEGEKKPPRSLTDKVEEFLRGLLLFDLNIIGYDTTIENAANRLHKLLFKEVGVKDAPAILYLISAIVNSLDFTFDGTLSREEGLLQRVFEKNLPTDLARRNEYEKVYTILLYVVFYKSLIEKTYYETIKGIPLSEIKDGAPLMTKLFDAANSRMYFKYNMIVIKDDKHLLTNWVSLWALHIINRDDEQNTKSADFLKYITDTLVKKNGLFAEIFKDYELMHTDKTKTISLSIPKELRPKIPTKAPEPSPLLTTPLVTSPPADTSATVPELPTPEPPEDIGKKSALSSPTPKRKNVIEASDLDTSTTSTTSDTSEVYDPTILGTMIISGIPVPAPVKMTPIIGGKEELKVTPPSSPKKGTVRSAEKSTPIKRLAFSKITPPENVGAAPKLRGKGSRNKFDAVLFTEYLQDYLKRATEPAKMDPEVKEAAIVEINAIKNPAKITVTEFNNIKNDLVIRAQEKKKIKNGGKEIDSFNDKALMSEKNTWTRIDVKINQHTIDLNDQLKKWIDSQKGNISNILVSDIDPLFPPKTEANVVDNVLSTIKERLDKYDYRRELMVMSWLLLEAYSQDIPNENPIEFAYMTEYIKYFAYMLLDIGAVRPWEGKELELAKQADAKPLQKYLVPIQL